LRNWAENFKHLTVQEHTERQHFHLKSNHIIKKRILSTYYFINPTEFAWSKLWSGSRSWRWDNGTYRKRSCRPGW
jgi:hypothetical protein